MHQIQQIQQITTTDQIARIQEIQQKHKNHNLICSAIEQLRHLLTKDLNAARHQAADPICIVSRESDLPQARAIIIYKHCFLNLVDGSGAAVQGQVHGQQNLPELPF